MLTSMTSVSMFLDVACILFVTKLYMRMKVMLLHLPQIRNVYMIGYAKEQCLLVGPKHEVYSYIHATSVGQMFGTKQYDT
jgi:hypothetical protein